MHEGNRSPRPMRMEAKTVKPRHPLVSRLAELLVSTWGEYLQLEPYHLPADLGFVEGQLEGDRLTIVNRCYQSRVFRKLHLELATIGPNLDILHCVMYPRPQFDLPIYGTDIVASTQMVSAAIVDLSPVRGELPPAYLAGLEPSFARCTDFGQLRNLPPWGTIFSPRCVFARVVTPTEADLFMEISRAYLRFHCEQAARAEAVDTATEAQILAGQRHYCEQQQQNDKTRRILAQAFDEAWAERYIRTVLFDLPQ
ncbi:phycocyanobilin:ferredoxin oxidoreductase [Gloeobacter violaceus]|uniref:Phycocyanobilin:ferredoxin oxidoreductase n=1 Tax=Gloeobacter violaceus (strain ATCC 29082 / PCC 7421) TaxID=251221 RepID=PCYA_GLOVI|nr:RecName: Full=Phycocyanobilin:ferredoxin oxidoreductase [Gloeobacter violaceus PCC 7421]BAC90530.1 phycocyanobilin:ferredoxin oxidoreductase [Gloeobacter violaceus PCC 7421]